MFGDDHDGIVDIIIRHGP